MHPQVLPFSRAFNIHLLYRTEGGGVQATWFQISDIPLGTIPISISVSQVRKKQDQKHLYLLASSEMSQPSVTDESWLEHGYMTFLIKHYFNFTWCGFVPFPWGLSLLLTI